MLKVQVPVAALLEIPANPARHRAARDWTGKSMIEFDIPLMHCRLARHPAHRPTTILLGGPVPLIKPEKLPKPGLYLSHTDAPPFPEWMTSILA